MDGQYPFATRDEIWRVNNDVRDISTIQAQHEQRLLRLEKRNQEDAKMKSVWGPSSPFPGLLGGMLAEDSSSPSRSLSDLKCAPDSSYNPAAEAFKNFDQDQQASLMGSLHLDNDEDPRRGAASRANSVRFDESAMHGQGRSSGDLLPSRTGSGLGSHPLTERSYSHRSEGRQSLSGLSTHSVRTNSLGLEASRLVDNNSLSSSSFVPAGPPPGLFVLGPVPCIIRCWLTRNFSNDTLLYGAVCTGSYTSSLEYGMVARSGLEEQIYVDENGTQKIKIPVYLPEATVQQTASRTNGALNQLPTITIEFTIRTSNPHDKTIQIVIGSDVLRTHNADIMFSQDRILMQDDERSKIAIPLVRPEKEVVYKTLCTGNAAAIGSSQTYVDENQTAIASSLDERNSSTGGHSRFFRQVNGQSSPRPYSPTVSSHATGSEAGEKPKQQLSGDEHERATEEMADVQAGEQKDINSDGEKVTPTRQEPGGIWGSWRRESAVAGKPESVGSSRYQRDTRGRGMKVLKPSKSNVGTGSRSMSNAMPLAGSENTPTRSSFEGNRKEIQDLGPRRTLSEVKTPLKTADLKAGDNLKTRSANPVGGASAFSWMNPQPKRAE